MFFVMFCAMKLMIGAVVILPVIRHLTSQRDAVVFYAPDGGTLRVNGAEVKITGPRAAQALGIGIIHQGLRPGPLPARERGAPQAIMACAGRDAERGPLFGLVQDDIRSDRHAVLLEPLVLDRSGGSVVDNQPLGPWRAA